jgi:hypothetical protein
MTKDAEISINSYIQALQKELAKLLVIVSLFLPWFLLEE